MTGVESCSWPACLTDAEAAQLAGDIVAELSGHTTAARPDKTREYRCTPQGQPPCRTR